MGAAFGEVGLGLGSFGVGLGVGALGVAAYELYTN